MQHSTGAPTKYEAERITAMLKLGCVCCSQLFIWNIAVDVHHIIIGGKRVSHWYTLPICPGHHRGVWTPEQVEVIPPLALIAISDGSKRFNRIYGTQRELWVTVQHRLELPAIWPITKILPRRGGNHVSSDVAELLASTPPTPTLLPRGTADRDRPGTGPEAAAGDTP